MHVEQRQGVHEDVVGGPRPGVRDRVQGGGEGPPGEDGALGRAGGAGGVDDEGGSRGAGFRPYVGAGPCDAVLCAFVRLCAHVGLRACVGVRACASESVRTTPCSVRTSIRGRCARDAGSSSPGAASTASGALSVTMWVSSRGPVLGLSGTAGTPRAARRPPPLPSPGWAPPTPRHGGHRRTGASARRRPHGADRTTGRAHRRRSAGRGSSSGPAARAEESIHGSSSSSCHGGHGRAVRPP